jgi:tetratricopeptide (TPR) repeat protein
VAGKTQQLLLLDMSIDTSTFNEGDIFYTQYDGKYHLYKLLRRDDEMEGFHGLSYTPLEELPGQHGLDGLEVMIYHSPIHRESFRGAKLLGNSPVTDDELIGYYEYLKRMEEDFEDSVQHATEHYHEAYRLTDEGKHEAAIEAYSKAIELVPTFFEAIDNRGFCKMDLGRWRDAIEDFRLSLEVNPDSLLAEFSMGECYYRLGDFHQAKAQFEKCVKLDPAHQVSKDFLLKSEEMAKAAEQQQ